MVFYFARETAKNVERHKKKTFFVVSIFYLYKQFKLK